MAPLPILIVHIPPHRCGIVSFRNSAYSHAMTRHLIALHDRNAIDRRSPPARKRGAPFGNTNARRFGGKVKAAVDLLLVDPEARFTAAAEKAGCHRRAIYAALGKPHVQAYAAECMKRSLSVFGYIRVSRVVLDLMENARSERVRADIVLAVLKQHRMFEA